MPTAPYTDQPDNLANEMDSPAEGRRTTGRDQSPDPEHTLDLLEEQLVARKELHELGAITVRTAVDAVPGRLVVEDPQQTGMVRERYPTDEAVRQTPGVAEPAVSPAADAQEVPEGGLLEHLVRKALS
jgi:hypothetical protein